MVIRIKIIICSFIAGSGKDTCADYLVKKYNFNKLAFADKIYSIAYDLFEMTTKNRELLINIGEKLREIDPYVWINYTYKKAEEYIKQGKNIVISDCRKIEELETGLNKGYIPIRIVSNRDIAIKRLIKRDGKCDESLLDNPVEIGTRSAEMIEIYNNDTIEELYRQVDGLIKWMEANFGDSM
jgi:dephospho-CoA kinase